MVALKFHVGIKHEDRKGVRPVARVSVYEPVFVLGIQTLEVFDRDPSLGFPLALADPVQAGAWLRAQIDDTADRRRFILCPPPPLAVCRVLEV